MRAIHTELESSRALVKQGKIVNDARWRASNSHSKIINLNSKSEIWTRNQKYELKIRNLNSKRYFHSQTENSYLKSLYHKSKCKSKLKTKNSKSRIKTPTWQQLQRTEKFSPKSNLAYHIAKSEIGSEFGTVDLSSSLRPSYWLLLLRFGQA